jgi:alkanesulfonate monooxygenase SsuD/methylene tetrahydromethanopterin reductase-like flavin-dependent oxidoreductase (luciferase family)
MNLTIQSALAGGRLTEASEHLILAQPSYIEIRDVAQQMVGAGFDAIWLADHLLYRPPGHPSTGSVADSASSTSRKSLRARSSRASPASVSSTRCVDRFNS